MWSLFLQHLLFVVLATLASMRYVKTRYSYNMDGFLAFYMCYGASMVVTHILLLTNGKFSFILFAMFLFGAFLYLWSIPSTLYWIKKYNPKYAEMYSLNYWKSYYEWVIEFIDKHKKNLSKPIRIDH